MRAGMKTRYGKAARTVAVLAAVTLVHLSSTVYSQIEPPAIEWERTFGRAGESNDFAEDGKRTDVGGYILAGFIDADPPNSGQGLSEIPSSTHKRIFSAVIK